MDMLVKCGLGRGTPLAGLSPSAGRVCASEQVFVLAGG